MVWTGTQTACDIYVDELLASVWDNVVNVTGGVHGVADKIFKSSSSVTGVVRSTVNETLRRFRRDVDKFVRQYADDVTVRLGRAMVRYREFVRKVVGNAWLMYPQSVFNKTAGWRTGSELNDSIRKQGDTKFELEKNDIEFLRFLDIYEAESVSVWRKGFIDRSV